MAARRVPLWLYHAKASGASSAKGEASPRGPLGTNATYDRRLPFAAVIFKNK